MQLCMCVKVDAAHVGFACEHTVVEFFQTSIRRLWTHRACTHPKHSASCSPPCVCACCPGHSFIVQQAGACCSRSSSSRQRAAAAGDVGHSARRGAGAAHWARSAAAGVACTRRLLCVCGTHRQHTGVCVCSVYVSQKGASMKGGAAGAYNVAHFVRVCLLLVGCACSVWGGGAE
jgi:hypothetical protein